MRERYSVQDKEALEGFINPIEHWLKIPSSHLIGDDQEIQGFPIMSFSTEIYGSLVVLMKHA